MKNFRGDPALFKDLPPFSWLSEEQLSWALPTIQHRDYPARALILRAGAPADGLYILLSGRVRLVYENSEGREFIAAVVGPHDFFGELGLFEGSECIASVRSVENCEVLFIPRPVVLECLEDNARAAMCMLRKVAKRLGTCQRKLAQFALSDVYERVAGVLVENTAQIEGEWLVQVGSEQIAGLVGSSREMVSRVIAKMVDQGIARKLGRKLIIVDRQALSQKAAHPAHATRANGN